VTRSPLDEALQADLLLALAADGSQSEAIDSYSRFRGRLVEELGVEPGPELQAAYRAVISRGDLAMADAADAESPTTPDIAVAASSAPPPPAVTPAQLPSGLRVFTGRAELVDDCVRFLLGERISLPILALDGMPGVGKTTMAVHVAHAVASHFPDGQLYADLRGFDADNRMTESADVLHAFLGALGISHDMIPASLDARASLYRSVVAGRQLLIVLDNARDAQQIRPLLPGTPGHAVVVTSRGRLSGLATTNGAHLHSLDVLTYDEARDCLIQRLGTARVDREPQAVSQIIERCGRLPLALAIVAARAAATPGYRLTDIAEELLADTTSLDGFSDDEWGSDLRTIFTWSYRLLSPEAAQTLRLFPLLPGPDVTVEIVASLTGATPQQARSNLAELVRTRLLNRYRSGRYRLHDLVRAYAAELCSAQESQSAVEEARHRIFSHYLCSTYAASQIMRPGYAPVGEPKPREGVTTQQFENRASASSWFMDERSNIRIVIEATRDDDTDTCWHLALFAKEMYTAFQLLSDWEATARTALDADENNQDIQGLAYTHHSLARVYQFLGDTSASARHLRQAGEMFQICGDSIGQAQILMQLGYEALTQQQHREPIDYLRQAHDVVASAGRSDLEIYVLTMLADAYRATGDLSSSAHSALAALRLTHGLRNIEQQARAMIAVARIYCDDGRYNAAIRIVNYCVEESFRDGNTLIGMHMQITLGDILYASGEVDDAYQIWTKIVLDAEKERDTAALLKEVKTRIPSL
jgi:tetratricopeptide (TPR) repeat protein